MNPAIADDKRCGLIDVVGLDGVGTFQVGHGQGDFGQPIGEAGRDSRLADDLLETFEPVR